MVSTWFHHSHFLMANKSHTCAVSSTTCSLRGHLLFPSKGSLQPGMVVHTPTPALRMPMQKDHKANKTLSQIFFFPIDFLVLGHF